MRGCMYLIRILKEGAFLQYTWFYLLTVALDYRNCLNTYKLVNLVFDNVT